MAISSVTSSVVSTVTSDKGLTPTVIPYHVSGTDEDRIADAEALYPTFDGVDVKLADNPLLYDADEFEAVSDLAEVEDEIEALQRKQTAVDAEIAELETTRAEQEAALAQAAADAEEARAAVPPATDTIAGTEALTASDDDTPALNDKIAALDAEIAELDAKIAALDAADGTSGAEALRADYVAQVKALTGQLSVLNASLATASEQLAATNDKLLAVEAAIAALDAGPQTDATAAQRALLVTQWETYSSQVSSLVGRIDSMTGQMVALDANIATLNAAIAAADAAIPSTAERDALLAERSTLVADREALGADRASVVSGTLAPAIDALQSAEAAYTAAAKAETTAELTLDSTQTRLDMLTAQAAAIPDQLAALNAERDALAAAVPAADTSNVTLEQFLLAHTAHQLEFLALVGGEFTFGTGDDAITFIASTDGTKVINVNALSVGSAAALSTADQQKVIATDAWAAVADQLGLVPNSATTAAEAKAAADALVSAVDTAIGDAAYGAEFVDDKQVFKSELENLQAQIDGGVIFSLEEIGSAANEINSRFERAAAFSLGVENSATANGSGLDGETLRQGYEEFIAQEKNILFADNRMRQITKLAALGVPTLDLPSLIVELQTLFEDMANSERDILTEDTRQHNALLRDYSTMIGRLGDTISATNPTKADDRKTYQGLPADGQADRVDLMFTADGQALHPLEILNGLTDRVDFNLTDNLRRDEWENLKNQLSDGVTTLNQNTQIRQNEISQKNSQANRHFEIVGDTIRRLFDLLQTIGRNV